MFIDLPTALILSTACAPSVAPETLLSVVSVESGFDPLAIGVNGATPRAIKSATKAQAIRVAAALLAKGANLDLGLGQVNSSNLDWLGLGLADAFDPCRNLAASARVLTKAYGRALRAGRDEQTAVRAALSVYNTGDERRGFKNGYVARTLEASARLVPAIAAQVGPDPHPAAAEASDDAPKDAARPPWDVFGQAADRKPRFVFSPSPKSGAAP